MKLYSANLSPFAARPRMAVYAKGLEVEITRPPADGLKSPEYLRINPLGKVPALLGDNGFSIGESGVIVEYLEERFPERPLLPADAEGRARVRFLASVGELYIMDPLRHLFSQANPETRDEKVADTLLDALATGLGYLESCLTGSRYAYGETLTSADCQLLPCLYYVRAMAPAFGRTTLFDACPKVSAYMETAGTDPVVARIFGEMAEAYDLYLKTGEVI